MTRLSIPARRCSGEANSAPGPDLHLEVLPVHTTRARKSHMSRWRAASLIAVHLLMIGHILHWWATGRTLSPVEPSEAMYTLNQGHVNAGFIFFALVILATLLLGRFFCGWGCHLVAYQDLCAWLLKKIGIRVKPFRSRILVLAPLALAIYMFIWPTAFRWFVAAPAPTLTNHLTTTAFWKTFPSVGVALLTFAICGFAIVYILGAKGFCAYACPYGGFFGLVDRAAVGRIRVTDACEHCGHCTAVCSSNVRVHEEVARFGMVVDPGCMKCMDCVSVCPNDALFFGFAAPSILRRNAKIDNRHSPDPRTQRVARPHYDFSFGEEILMLAAGLSALFAYRGLYGQIPLLLAMGMAAITAYLAIKFLHLLRSANVKMQNVQFKRGRRVTRAGWTFAATAVAVFAFTLHSLAVQYNLWRGRVLSASADLDDEVWLPGNVWWEKASFKQHAAVHSAIAHIERAEAWGFLSTPAALHDLVRLQLAEGDVAAAERTARRLADLIPDQPQPHLSLGGVLRRTDRFSEAEAAYRTAIRIDPTCSPARRELGALLGEQRRFDDAVALYREGMETHSSDAQWRTELVRSLMAAGRFAEAKTDLLAMIESDGESGASLAQLGVAELQTADIEHGLKHLRRALELDPSMTEARYNLAVALLALRQVPDATALLERVVTENPTMAQARYNLAVAVFMSGRPADALPQVREALRLAPDDLQARGFLSLILEQLNSSPGIAPSGASVSPD